MLVFQQPAGQQVVSSEFHMKITPRFLILTRAAILVAWVDAAPTARPHVIFILADDMGLGDLGCYGGKQAPTPRLDRLASEGMRFTQFYSASPVCSPSRAGWMTGMFPARWRITNYLQTREGNRSSEQADFLDPKAPSIARQMKAAGYATGHFGKWHLGGGRDVADAPKISAYGFDENASTWESPEPHPDIEGGNAPAKVKRRERTAFFVERGWQRDGTLRRRRRPQRGTRSRCE